MFGSNITSTQYICFYVLITYHKTINMDDYYIKNKDKLIKMFDKYMEENFKSYFIENYPNENYQEFKIKTQIDLEELIPTIPYIGGFNNISTQYLVGAPMVVALYKNIKPLEIEDEEFGKLIFDTFGDYMTPNNRVIRWLARLLVISLIGKWRAKRNARSTPKYEKEWQIDYIGDKDDKDLIYLMRYNKCGLQEYMDELDYPHLTPYLCVIDYKLLGNMNIGFKRTQTIAMGGSHCDFQFRKNYKTPVKWDPEKFDDYREFIKQR